MTSALKQVFDEALKLPGEKQDSLAIAFEEHLNNFKKSGFNKSLAHLSDEAIQEHRRGETEPMNLETQAIEDKISEQIKRGMAEIKAGQGVEARTAMREIAEKFDIRVSR